MAKYTESYNLILPDSNESYDIEVANTNNKIVDNELRKKVEKIEGKGLSTNDFTNNYKKKIDSMQRIYYFKGKIQSNNELSQENNVIGDVWFCEEDNTNYVWDGVSWVNIGLLSEIDMSGYLLNEEFNKEKEKILNNIKNKASKIDIETKIEANTDYVLPINYMVGNNSLEIYYCETKLMLGYDYIEVGSNSDISNKIQFKEAVGDINTSEIFEEFKERLEIIVRGDYSAD